MAGTLETENAVERRAFKSARKEDGKRKWHEKKCLTLLTRRNPGDG